MCYVVYYLNDYVCVCIIFALKHYLRSHKVIVLSKNNVLSFFF